MRLSRHSRILSSALAVALATAAGGALAHDHDRGDRRAADSMTAPQVRAALEADGYTDIRDVEFDDGMWKADAKSAEGRDVDLRIDAKTGRIYPENATPTLGEADIRAKLSAAGYTNVRDVEFDDGLWKAEADDRDGRKVDLRLDGGTGAIVGRDR